MSDTSASTGHDAAAASDMVGRLRDRAMQSDRAVDVYRRVRAVRQVAATRGGFPSFDELPPDVALRMAYQILLRREPDPTGVGSMLPLLESGELTYDDLLGSLLGSDEFFVTPRFRHLSPSLHTSRCTFIRSLPRGARILDLGGTHLHRDEGALLAMGYPYPFEELVIMDLPHDERHPLYQESNVLTEVETDLGPVRYQYHSMTDLSRYDDESFDLVYSGQTFEHVTEAEGDHVLAEVLRILRPGGHLGLDTPNGRATRMQQPHFIDPDHEVEYDEPTLTKKIEAAGFEISRVQGLNHLGSCIESGNFSFEETAKHHGVYDAADECYLLAYVCRKPTEPQRP